MSLLSLLIITAVTATTLSTTVPTLSTETTTTESSAETFDSYAVRNLPPQLPQTIQLPNPELAIPFYPPEPVTYLKAPQFIPNPPPNYYQVPIPSDILTAPPEETWNPSNDPALYYELPASITKEELPTRLFAKKFNPEIHSKNKPLSTIPKKEIILEPIDEDQYNQKQKDLYKAVDSLNKQENKKKIEQEKVPVKHSKPKKTEKTDKPKNTTSSKTKHTKSTKPPTQKPSPSKNITELAAKDSTNSETSFKPKINHKPHHNSNKFTKGLPTKVTDSLGLSTYQGPKANPGERVLFHMVGHDGPMSYKWGYDTGKGHNRQFRFEERDKEGVVTGQYGYYDKDGKFRMMNYNAHPHLGFHMEPAPESDDNK